MDFNIKFEFLEKVLLRFDIWLNECLYSVSGTNIFTFSSRNFVKSCQLAESMDLTNPNKKVGFNSNCQNWRAIRPLCWFKMHILLSVSVQSEYCACHCTKFQMEVYGSLLYHASYGEWPNSWGMVYLYWQMLWAWIIRQELKAYSSYFILICH